MSDRLQKETLQRLTERIWFLPYEEETDRPCLYYVRGDRKSLAIDAGNSPAHVEKFYRALTEAGLPLPEMTVLTHWHWDHTFGIGAVNGPVLASALTMEKLRSVRGWAWTEAAMRRREETGEDIAFCNECIRKEYPDLSQIQVALPDVALADGAEIDLGGVTCRLICRDSTHSRDSMFIYLPEEQALAVGDGDCGDFYENNGAYDRARAESLLAFLESVPYQYHLYGHAQPYSKEAALEEFLRESGLEKKSTKNS